MKLSKISKHGFFCPQPCSSRENRRGSFDPFVFRDHAVFALFGSSVLGIGDFPFSAGMQQ